MKIQQLYRVRSMELNSDGGQFASLTLVPHSATPADATAAAGIARAGIGAGAVSQPQEFRLSGIPIAALDGVGLDSVGTFTFTPSE